MAETPTTDISATPVQTRESAVESSASNQGKDETPRRRSVQFEDSPLNKATRSEPMPPDPKNTTRRSSLVKKSGGSEKEKEAEPSGRTQMDAPPQAEVSPEVMLEAALPPSAVVIVAEAVQPGAEVDKIASLDNSKQSSWSMAPAEESLPSEQQQEDESKLQSPVAATHPPDNTQSSRDPESPRSDPEQEEKGQTNQTIPSDAARNFGVSYSDSDNEGENEREGKKSKRGSATGPRRSRKKSSAFKEIIGSIEKKKGPNLPEKLGFGSSSERKNLMVESLKEKKKSSMIIPKESDEIPKLPDRRKTAIQGLGFGSSEPRKSLFDKVDPLKPNDKRKSLNSKEDEKDTTGGKSRRTSSMKDSESSSDSRGTSSKQSTILALKSEDVCPRVAEHSEQTSGETELETYVNQQSSEEWRQQGQLPVDQTATLFAGGINQYAQETEAGMERVADVRYTSEDPGGDDHTEDHEIMRRMSDRPPSLYGSDLAGSNYYASRAPSIDAIPLDNNEGLTRTLLAAKVDEPLRNELENWLSSAINRVENNLSSSFGGPVLRQDTSVEKSSTRHSIPPTRSPRNTLVVLPDSSSTTSSERPPLVSMRPVRRMSALSLGILSGTISDENRSLQTGQVTDSTLSPVLDVQGFPVQDITPRLAPKIVPSRVKDDEESSWNQETAEEGLRRLQREVEQRAWAQYVSKKAPRLLLPDLRKRKKPGASVDYLHAESSQKPEQNILNRDFLCYYGRTEHPQKLRSAGLSGLNIVGVEQTDLELFRNLQYLDLSVNRVNMNDLWIFSALRKLSLMSNQMCYLSLTAGQFNQLQALDLSYNLLGGSAIVHLANLPALETLNLDHNSIAEIPEANGEPWSFTHLKIFSAAHNFIKNSSLIPLSKIPRLEKLLLAYNDIVGVPDEVNGAGQAFPRLEILDLSNNKVADSEKLIPLLRCRKLKQVLLCATPVAKKVVCDGANRLLESAKPTLSHILRAARAGQRWITEQSPPPTAELEANMHIIKQYKPPEIKLFDTMAEQEMAYVFQYTSETVSKEVGDKHCKHHKGYTSAILPFTEGFQSPVMSLSETKVTDRAQSALSEVATSDIPPSMDEAMESMQLSKSLTENHLTNANAAIVCLQNTLGVPFREVDFSPRHYLTMTKSGIIRVNEYRLGNQPLISPRKDAVYLAQRFLHQAEVLFLVKDSSGQLNYNLSAPTSLFYQLIQLRSCL